MIPENIIWQKITFEKSMGPEYMVVLPMVARRGSGYRMDRALLVVAIYRAYGKNEAGEYVYEFQGVDIT
jgi:hypothetical protein